MVYLWVSSQPYHQIVEVSSKYKPMTTLSQSFPYGDQPFDSKTRETCAWWIMVQGVLASPPEIFEQLDA